MLTTAARDPGPRPTWQHGVVAESAAMRAILELVARVAPTTLPVVLEGETGTGKDVIARAVHDASGRTGRFVPINCAAIPTALIESELFGFVRGAFTGAEVTTAGLFEDAVGGTLFLDEVGELALGVQAKLLRAIENGEVRRIGSRQTTIVETRLVAATNRNLLRAVDDGGFREDLYHRLAGIVIQVPPLRTRGEDIEFLARRFMIEATEMGHRPLLPPATVGWLRRQRWEGNVRELRQAMRRAVVLGGPLLVPEHFALPSAPPEPRLDSEETTSAFDDWLDGKRWAEIETSVLRWALRRFGGLRAAAKALDVPRSTLSDKARRLGVEHPRLRAR